MQAELDNLLRENRELGDARSGVATQQGKEQKDELKVLSTLDECEFQRGLVKQYLLCLRRGSLAE